MSSYLKGKWVGCNDIDSAGCDRCDEGARGWQDAQQEASREWQQVQVFDEVRVVRGVLDDRRRGCNWGVAEAQGDAVHRFSWPDRYSARQFSTEHCRLRRKPQL